MNRPSHRNIQWNKFKHSRHEQLRGLIEALRFAGKTDAEIIEIVKQMEKAKPTPAPETTS